MGSDLNDGSGAITCWHGLAVWMQQVKHLDLMYLAVVIPLTTQNSRRTAVRSWEGLSDGGNVER